MDGPNGAGRLSTASDVRSIVAELPGACEQDHLGAPSFRVNGKIFAQLTRDEALALVKMPLDEQAARVAAEPERWALPDHWSRFGWTYVRLGRTQTSELRELLEASWCAIAGKKAAQALRSARAASGAASEPVGSRRATTAARAKPERDGSTKSIF